MAPTPNLPYLRLYDLGVGRGRSQGSLDSFRLSGSSRVIFAELGFTGGTGPVAERLALETSRGDRQASPASAPKNLHLVWSDWGRGERVAGAIRSEPPSRRASGVKRGSE
jgi:hypothetical protein